MLGNYPHSLRNYDHPIFRSYSLSSKLCPLRYYLPHQPSAHHAYSLPRASRFQRWLLPPFVPHQPWLCPHSLSWIRPKLRSHSMALPPSPVVTTPHFLTSMASPKPTLVTPLPSIASHDYPILDPQSLLPLSNVVPTPSHTLPTVAPPSLPTMLLPPTRTISTPLVPSFYVHPPRPLPPSLSSPWPPIATPSLADYSHSVPPSSAMATR